MFISIRIGIPYVFMPDRIWTLSIKQHVIVASPIIPKFIFFLQLVWNFLMKRKRPFLGILRKPNVLIVFRFLDMDFLLLISPICIDITSFPAIIFLGHILNTMDSLNYKIIVNLSEISSDLLKDAIYSRSSSITARHTGQCFTQTYSLIPPQPVWFILSCRNLIMYQEVPFISSFAIHMNIMLINDAVGDFFTSCLKICVRPADIFLNIQSQFWFTVIFSLSIPRLLSIEDWKLFSKQIKCIGRKDYYTTCAWGIFKLIKL